MTRINGFINYIKEGVMYQLKSTSPDFRVVDGPFAGRIYLSGKRYQDIPPQEAHKFDEVPENTEKPVKFIQKINEGSAVNVDAVSPAPSGEAENNAE
jgi:hypothetical protein